MEKLQSRFETFEKAVSQFEPLSRDIVVSQLKVLKSTPSLNDIKTLNYLLDDLSKPEDATLMNGDYGKYSNEYDYNFKAMKGTELEEKYKKEYEKHYKTAAGLFKQQPLYNTFKKYLSWDHNIINDFVEYLKVNDKEIVPN